MLSWDETLTPWTAQIDAVQQAAEIAREWEEKEQWEVLGKSKAEEKRGKDQYLV